MRLLAIAWVLALSVGCNTRDPVLDTAVTVGGPSPAIPGVMLGFDPPGVMGGGVALGTVTLGQPAPGSGAVVTLQRGSAAVSIPSSVTVEAGSRTATFEVRATSVATDTAAPVTASVSGASATASLAVWAVLPTYFSVVSEPGGFIGSGGFRRFTPQTATFTASCEASEVTAFITSDGEFWRANFGAPRGTPLRPGTYEGATRTAFRNATNPGIDVTLGGCNQTAGRFTVHEVSVTARGIVQQFWATFEQYCDQNPAALRGEVRVTGIPRGNNTVGSCIVP